METKLFLRLGSFECVYEIPAHQLGKKYDVMEVPILLGDTDLQFQFYPTSLRTKEGLRIWEALSYFELDK